MNFLVMVLSVALDLSYLLHYFVPLITFSYTLTAVTMTAWLAITQIIIVLTKDVSDRPRTIAFAIVLFASTAFSAILQAFPVVFNAIFYTG